MDSVYVIFHLIPIFEELVKCTDFAAHDLDEVQEWITTSGDENTHYYWLEYLVKDKESYIARINSKDNYEEE